MLSELCPRNYLRYERSPFAADLEAFASWLLVTGYSRENIQDHLSRLCITLDRVEGLATGTAVAEARLEAAFSSLRSPVLYRGTQRAFARFLKDQGRLVPSRPNDRFVTVHAQYRQYLAELRGFSATTIQQHQSTVAEFLSHSDAKVLGDLTAVDVERYVQRKSKEVSRQTLQHTVARLRAFLRYSRDRGETAAALECIDTPRAYRGELPPRALDWKLVLRLLASVDRASRAGWRDYAVLHLMAYYGLRHRRSSPSSSARLTGPQTRFRSSNVRPAPRWCCRWRTGR